MDKPVHTLIVDDEPSICFFLKETLERIGHRVVTVHSGEDALARLRDTFFDLVLLDLHLGGRVDGIRVLETAKWRWPETAVIILTAYGSLDTALAAIREGVDGYLLKPVGPAEVRDAVQKALSRRTGSVSRPGGEKQENVLRYGALFLDMDKHLATHEGHPVALTPGEFQLLAYFMKHRQRAITPRELVRVIREYEPDTDQEAREIIKWYIHRLRRKIEPNPSSPQYIVNIRGVGYTLGRQIPSEEREI